MTENDFKDNLFGLLNDYGKEKLALAEIEMWDIKNTMWVTLSDGNRFGIHFMCEEKSIANKEKKQFESIIDLFSETNQYKTDFHIVPFEELGYLTAQFINNDGSIESVVLHRTPMELYRFLENDWETEWLFFVKEMMGMKEMDNELFIEILPQEKRMELERFHRKHSEGIKKIIKIEKDS